MRRGPALVLAIGLAVMATLLVGGPASAHNQVVSSTPSSGETLTELPSAFSIVTNEGLLDLGGQGSGFAFEIRDAGGRFYGDGCVTISDATMTTPAALGAPGAYTVIYQLVSADGHSVSGEIPFTWAPTGSVTPSVGAASPPTCPGSTAKASAPGTGSGNADRNATVPLGDVLWIGGALVAVALAVAVTLLVVTRRRRDA